MLKNCFNLFVEFIYCILDADWNEAPINELVRMDDVPFILYSGRQQKFICEASTFLFAEPLQFEIIYVNGSKLAYDLWATPDLKVTDLKYGPRYVDGVNQIHQLELEIKVEMSAVRCGASFGNSTDTMWTSRTFEVRGGLNIIQIKFALSATSLQLPH